MYSSFTMSLESSQKSLSSAKSQDEIHSSFFEDVTSCLSSKFLDSEDEKNAAESTNSFDFNTDSCCSNKQVDEVIETGMASTEDVLQVGDKQEDVATSEPSDFQFINDDYELSFLDEIDTKINSESVENVFLRSLPQKKTTSGKSGSYNYGSQVLQNKAASYSVCESVSVHKNPNHSAFAYCDIIGEIDPLSAEPYTASALHDTADNKPHFVCLDSHNPAALHEADRSIDVENLEPHNDVTHVTDDDLFATDDFCEDNCVINDKSICDDFDDDFMISDISYKEYYDEKLVTKQDATTFIEANIKNDYNEKYNKDKHFITDANNQTKNNKAMVDNSARSGDLNYTKIEYFKTTSDRNAIPKAIDKSIFANEDFSFFAQANSFNAAISNDTFSGFQTASNTKISIKEESILFANKLKEEINDFEYKTTKLQTKNNTSEKINIQFGENANEADNTMAKLQTKNDTYNRANEKCIDKTIDADNTAAKLQTKNNTYDSINAKCKEITIEAENTNDIYNKTDLKPENFTNEFGTKTAKKYKASQANDPNANIEAKKAKIAAYQNPSLSQKSIDANCKPKIVATKPGVQNLRVPGIQKSRLSASRPMRSYLKPEVGHISTMHNYIQNLKRIYVNLKKNHKNKEEFENHFKWSWFHFYSINCEEVNVEMYKNWNTGNIELVDMSFYNKACNFLENEITKRFDREYSILKRIVEGDDISIKYMILAVIEIKNDVLNVFDGFYSVNVKLDKDLQKMIISQKIRKGTCLRIFGAKLLIQNTALKNVKDECVLSLNYNCVKICEVQKLGYQKKKGFYISVKDIIKTGGNVSGLELKIVKIIERKLLVKVGNYKNVVDENVLEKEIDKIKKLMKEAQQSESFENKLVIKKVAKVLVKDIYDSECLLTWYGYDEISVNECFGFFMLKVGKDNLGLHLFSGFDTVAIPIKKLHTFERNND